MRSWPSFGIVLGFMVWAVTNVDNLSVSSIAGSGIGSYTQITIEDVGSLLTKLRMKVFDDRAVVWRGAWSDMSKPPYLARTTAVRGFADVQTASGRYVDELPFGAHNVFLEVLARLRWPAGILFCVMFIVFIVRAGSLLREPHRRDLLVPICGTIVGLGTFGAMCGMFPIGYDFGFVFMTLAGVCYGSARKKSVERRSGSC